jgi:hypothetical protein
MFGWTRIFTLVAVASMVAVVTGGAGATSTPTLAPATASHATAAGKASTAAASRGALLRTANLNTPAGAARYLRAIGVNPDGLVIQRGARNYAGPNCPGAGWACASTAHPVVQIAAAGGKNTYLCTTGRCAVVQATTAAATRTSRALTAAAATNTAKCNMTSGLTQVCSITQTPGADNVAIVVERAKQASSVTQTVSSDVTAFIRQTATGSNGNQACVYQEITETLTPTNGKKGASLTTTLEGHQSVEIHQDAASGNNTVQNAAAPPATAACVSGPLTQTQTLTSRATGTADITQNQNTAPRPPGDPNVSLDIKQNQSDGYLDSATTIGLNKAAFSQTNVLTAIANTPGPSVSQTQSSSSGGISANVNQFSHGKSTANATQSETQCEDAAPSGLVACSTTEHDPPFPPGLTQKQYGPVKNTGAKSPTAASRSLEFVRKDTGSIQSGNSQDRFTINQSSTQNNDTGANQTNTVQGACSTSGYCTVTQTTAVDGQPATTNTQSGQNVDTTTSCTGSTCTGTSPAGITFDGSPGTAAPPSTLGPYTMNAFGPDPQPLGDVSGVSDPAGAISFTPHLHHDQVPNGGWNNWSNNYTGDVYDTCFDNGSGCTAADPSQVRIMLPSGTNAFYFYSEANTYNTFTLQATAQDGTTSGPVSVTTPGGAKYFGFYGTGGATLSYIDVTANDANGFAVGEFGIQVAPAVIG